MRIDVSRACFHAEAQRLVLVRLPVENRMGADDGENWSVETEYVWHTGKQQAIGSVTGKITSQTGFISWDSARRICFTRKGIEFEESVTDRTTDRI